LRPHQTRLVLFPGLASLSACLLLSSALLTNCSKAPPPIEVPRTTTVKIKDPPELLSCRPWPSANSPLGQSAHQVDDLVALIAQAKAAHADCALKLKGIAAFQALQ
jgi:hypothetical protein